LVAQFLYFVKLPVFFMNNWEAVLLGLIQGFTEFLPVSSSGHLEIAQFLLGFKELDRYVMFNLICHLGTLTAIFLVFYPQIKTTLTSSPKRFFQIFLATLPLIPLIFILKPLKSIISQPAYLGPFFLISSLLLFLSLRPPINLPIPKKMKPWADSLLIGLFQAAAIFPGISRSGATISAAKILGWSSVEAIPFSFLLAIPAILGASILEGVQLLRNPEETLITMSWITYSLAFLTSLITGYFALNFLIRCFKNERWIFFAWYCFGLGTILTLTLTFD